MTSIERQQFTVRLQKVRIYYPTFVNLKLTFRTVFHEIRFCVFAKKSRAAFNDPTVVAIRACVVKRISSKTQTRATFAITCLVESDTTTSVAHKLHAMLLALLHCDIKVSVEESTRRAKLCWASEAKVVVRLGT